MGHFKNLQIEQQNETTHWLEFSLRDWKKGSEFLEKLGFNDEGCFDNTFDLTLTDEQETRLLDELNNLDLEWTMGRNREGRL